MNNLEIKESPVEENQQVIVFVYKISSYGKNVTL